MDYVILEQSHDIKTSEIGTLAHKDHHWWVVSNIFATEAKLPFGFACNQASPNIVIARNFVTTFKNYRCSPAPLSAFFIFFIQQKQRSLRLSCSLWSIDKWSGVMTLISDLVRPQLCMMEECPCSWWVGATLQLDILHSLRWMLLTARRLQYWNVSAISRISTGVHTLDPLRWLSSWLCAGRSWAGLGIWRHDMGMTRVWQGYDDTLFPDHRTRQHIRPRLLRLGECWPLEVRCLAVLIITAPKIVHNPRPPATADHEVCPDTKMSSV